LEIGELLACDEPNGIQLLQVYDLEYGSQIQPETIELMSGLRLEGKGEKTSFFEEELRHYVLAKVKGLVTVRGGKAVSTKTLPKFFNGLRRIRDADLSFLDKPEKPLFLGRLRSGSKAIDKRIELDGEKVLSHHVLVPATTGRGKSNLVKVMLYELLDKDYCGVLVMDPHNEYHKSLKKHAKAGEWLKSYSPNPEGGQVSLRVNYAALKPWHFNGVMPFSEAQQQTLHLAYKTWEKDWITRLLAGDSLGDKVQDVTLNVLQRKLGLILDGRVFVKNGSETIVDDVTGHLLDSKKVVIDTSRLGSEAELLVASVFTNALFNRRKAAQTDKPVVSIVLEEAPRVLSEAAGANVFSSIAREGRKFGVGLIAITQLASLIPREVLANLNTKIILGNEMKQEREALIASASQDLSTDDKAIAALDKGEAIVSSVFSRFAVPISIPLFEEHASAAAASAPARKAFV